jgi:hypothetical protein
MPQNAEAEGNGRSPKTRALPKKLGTVLLNLCRRERVCSRGREIDGDGGPLTYFTGEMNRATMLFNNFMCQRQSQSCAFRLCRPKRRKHLIDLGRGNTHAGILDHDLYICRVQVESRGRSFWRVARNAPVASGGKIDQGFGGRAAPDMQLSTRWHRFNGVQDDVGKAAMELFNVGEEWR